MQKLILCLLLGSIFFTSCTTDSFDAEEQQKSIYDTSELINTILQKQQAKNLQQRGTNSLTVIISQIEATALQEPAFLQLVTANYSTPQASNIENVVINPDLVLANLSISIVAKGFTSTLLNSKTVSGLNSLEQTIIHNLNLTTLERTVLLEVLDLKRQNISIDGNGDDWDKRRIIGYLQGAIQTKANAVLNTVIIKTIEN